LWHRLVVTQTWQNHEQVRQLMNLLRADPPVRAGGRLATNPTSRPKK